MSIRFTRSHSKHTVMNSSNRTMRNPSNNTLSKYLIFGGWILLVILVCVFISTSMFHSPKPFLNNIFSHNNLSKDDGEIIYKPQIFNSSTFLVVDNNDPFTLYCFLNNLPRNVPLLWKKIDDGWMDQANSKNLLIAIDSQVIEYQFINKASVVVSNEGSKLTINPASNTDSGLYECSLATPDNSLSIRYNVEVNN